MKLIGVDTGGTFTDAVAITEDGIVASKALSTPSRVEDGVLAAIDALAAQLSLSTAELLADTALIGHGTTVGLNAILTGTGARVGLITTVGFESTLPIAKANKVHGLLDEDLRRPTRWDKPPELVPRHRIRGVRERVDRSGATLEPLDEGHARAQLAELAALGVESIAVALLWSVTDPRAEHRIAALARELLPGLHLSLSSDLAPRLGEYERTCSVVLDAYVAPLVSSYLGRLQTMLSARGFTGPLLVTRMAGGVQTVADARRFPVQTLRSGPAGGLAAAGRIGAGLGHRNIIATDVGGTSFDVGLVIGGTPVRASRPMIDRYAIALPVIDIVSIGTGGGSIAWVDDSTGALRVGPKSAGADPGPVCYGRGGTQPTVTDAAAVLGYVERLGGNLELDVPAASAAIERDIAKPLGLTVIAAADGILSVACEQMKDLVRRTTVERGHDPADFVLYSYGGAGPQYAGRYATELGVREIVVPALAAQFSAFGAVANDVRVSAGQDLVPHELVPAILPELNAVLVRLSARVRADLVANQATLAGSSDLSEAFPGQTRLTHTLGLRYYRQVHRVEVPLAGATLTATDLAALAAAFQRRYEQVVGPQTARDGTAIEAVSVTVEATLPLPVVRHPPRTATAGVASGHRDATFAGKTASRPVYDWDELAVGQVVAGPAFIESPDTTVVVYPGQQVRCGTDGHLRLEIRRTEIGDRP